MQGHTREVGRVNPGKVVGEIAFLLGTPPSVSALSPPRRSHEEGADDDSRKTIVQQLDHAKIIQLLEQNPRLMRRFFFAVAANLSKSLQETAKQVSVTVTVM